MPTRTPASPEQVIESLSIRYGDLDERVVPMEDAIRAVRDDQHTSYAKAKEWVEAAALSDADLWITYAHDGGSMHGLLVHNPGTWPNITAPLVISGLAEGGDFTTSVGWSYIDTRGRYAPNDARSNLPFTKRGTYPFVGTRKGIQYLLDLETKATQARVTEMRAEGILRHAAFETEHGNAADYLRGLLHAAGITERGRKNEVSTYASEGRKGEGMHTSLEVTVYGSDIDRLVALLQRLGIEPVAKEG